MATASPPPKEGLSGGGGGGGAIPGGGGRYRGWVLVGPPLMVMVLAVSCCDNDSYRSSQLYGNHLGVICYAIISTQAQE